jgi:hypothetical protein
MSVLGRAQLRPSASFLFKELARSAQEEKAWTRSIGIPRAGIERGAPALVHAHESLMDRERLAPGGGNRLPCIFFALQRSDLKPISPSFLI